MCATPDGKPRTIVITRQYLLLLALLLASPAVTRAAQAAEATTTVPRFEPSPCPAPAVMDDRATTPRIPSLLAPISFAWVLSGRVSCLAFSPLSSLRLPF